MPRAGAAVWDLASPLVREADGSACAAIMSSGSRLKAVRSTEWSLLLGKEKLSERCLPPCVAIPAVLRQKLWYDVTDLQV